MFSFTNKEVTAVWNPEVDRMKKISKTASFNTFQQGTADVSLLMSELDTSCSG